MADGLSNSNSTDKRYDGMDIQHQFGKVDNGKKDAWESLLLRISGLGLVMRRSKNYLLVSG
jgi:hypothetical protein